MRSSLPRSVGSCACLGRRRFRCVRLVQALPSPPPSAGLAPCPSTSAFLFPCPFRVCPLRARCVGVGVCSFPLLLRSSSGPGEVAFHLILTLISSSVPISSLFSPHLPPCQRQGACVCVCVYHLNRCTLQGAAGTSMPAPKRTHHSTAAPSSSTLQRHPPATHL